MATVPFVLGNAALAALPGAEPVPYAWLALALLYDFELL